MRCQSSLRISCEYRVINEGLWTLKLITALWTIVQWQLNNLIHPNVFIYWEQSSYTLETSHSKRSRFLKCTENVPKGKKTLSFHTLFVITSHILGRDRKVGHVFNRQLLGKKSKLTIWVGMKKKWCAYMMKMFLKAVYFANISVFHKSWHLILLFLGF